MINETLYNRTVSILVDAYFKDKLRHGDCCACAVGNLIAANMNYSITPIVDDEKERWLDENKNRMPYPGEHGWGNVILNRQPIRNDLVKRQLHATEYSILQLILIEDAFEFRYIEYKDIPKGDHMFNGLMAVIDVLDEIHENNNTELTATTKLKFQKVCTV